MKKEVKKIQQLLGEIIQNMEQFSEHLQELKKDVIQEIHCKGVSDEQKLRNPHKN